jgi:hypothetical protein
VGPQQSGEERQQRRLGVAVNDSQLTVLEGWRDWRPPLVADDVARRDVFFERIVKIADVQAFERAVPARLTSRPDPWLPEAVIDSYPIDEIRPGFGEAEQRERVFRRWLNWQQLAKATSPNVGEET